MANLSQQKRQRMLEFIDKIREEHKDDDEMLIALGEIENELNSKKYGLVWEQHEEAVDVMMKDNIPVFTECLDKEIVADDSDNFNFLLEGDNLHSLKLLEKTHAGKVDVIYIDPPYNTGNTFIYNDTMIGDDDGYKHSKWASFMLERLKIAQKLLVAEGVIFISINDYESAQLKLICDEVFGENNFIGQLTWESTTQPTNAGMARFSLQKKVESIYCYAKDKKRRNGFILKEIESDLKYPHKGKFGACRFEIIEKSDAGNYKRDSMKFPILGQMPREGKRWQIGEQTARMLEEQGKLEIVDGIVKKAVYPEDELEKRKFAPFWSHLRADEVGTAQTGKEELNKIVNKAVGFDTVKPVNLIKEILCHLPKESVVLDFFAGSGHFLSKSLDYVQSKYSATVDEYTLHQFKFFHLHGIEKSDRMVRIAMTDMMLHDDGHTNIRNTDSLLSFENYPDILQLEDDDNTNPAVFDIILTNPPFGSLMTQEVMEMVGRFELGKGKKTLPMEYIGLERCFQFLKPGGKLAIVLPDGLLKNKNSKYVRK